MNLVDRVKETFDASIRIKTLAKESSAALIVQASRLLANRLRDGKKVLICGNGGSAADAQHCAAELVNRLLIERRPLPCIALSTDTSVITAIANDYSYDEIFAKQILALGKAKDILLAISTSGNSKNILRAIQVAHARRLSIIALTGDDGGLLRKLLQKGDLEIRVPARETLRIQETHILILHCLCELVDALLFC